MKKLITLLLAISFVATPAFAWNDDDPYDSSGNPNYRYKSYTGQKYQYDLSNPSDKLRYDVDPSAQLRDSINPSPRIDLDRDMGQYGGGAKW